MAPAETSMNNNERKHIKGFRFITKFKREHVRAGSYYLLYIKKKNSILVSTPQI